MVLLALTADNSDSFSRFLALYKFVCRCTYVLTMALADVAVTGTRPRSSTSWRRGIVVSGVRHMNEVNPRRAWLVLGWVTVFGRVYHPGM